MKKIIIPAILLFIYAVSAHAETRYVTDRFEATLRTGPGIEYRILRMVSSGQQVELIERGHEWSRVQIPGGPEGWMNNGYLQRDPVARDALQALTGRIGPLEAENDALRDENARLREVNREIAAQLESTEKRLEEAVSRYEALRADAAEFIEIREAYNELKGGLDEKEARIEELESRLTDQFLSSAIQWFLAGAGVLLLGMLLGSRSRKKRSSGLR